MRELSSVVRFKEGPNGLWIDELTQEFILNQHAMPSLAIKPIVQEEAVSGGRGRGRVIRCDGTLLWLFGVASCMVKQNNHYSKFCCSSGIL